MGALFSSPAKPKAPPPPPPPPKREDPAVQQAASDALKRRRLARGRASTILTGGRGVTGAAPSARKKLLGE